MKLYLLPVIVGSINLKPLGTEKIYVILQRALDKIPEEDLLRPLLVLHHS